MNLLIDLVQWFSPNYYVPHPPAAIVREAIQAKSDAADELIKQLRRMEEVMKK